MKGALGHATQFIHPVPKSPKFQMSRGLFRLAEGAFFALFGLSVFIIPLFFGAIDSAVGICRYASKWLDQLTLRLF